MRRSIPIHDATVPIACTIDAADIPERVELLERLRGVLRAVERTEHGLLLCFAPDAGTEADVRRFASEEHRCCAFWGFEVHTGPEELALRWDGPPDVTQLLDQLHAWFRREGDLPPIAELL